MRPKKKIPFIRESEPKYEGAKGFIPFEKFKCYFENINFHATTNDLKGLNEFVEFEIKVGLTINFDNFTAEESRLYTTFVLRPKKKTSLGVLYLKKHSFECLKGGDYHIGGETRVSKVLKVDGNNQAFNDLKSFLTQNVKIAKDKLYKLYLLTHTYIEGELKIGRTLKAEGLEFELVWSFTKGKEWISGFRKPALEMLLPGTVLVLKAKNEGCLKRLTYIEEKTILPVYESKDSKEIKDECINLHNYGWNYAILTTFKEV